MRGPGLWLSLGACTVRVRSDLASFARHLARVYAHFDFCDKGEWADIDVELRHAAGLRRWWRPQVTFVCDREQPFQPFPADTALPMFEWGVNWLISQRLTHLLLLHAAVLERDGRALVLPATPGSGKSTLAAALSLRGWRLLSDEFGAYCPESRQFWPVLKPVALKNESIRVIASLDAAAPLGPSFPNTRKGTVAHLAATAGSAARRHEAALPGMVVLPRWHPEPILAFDPLPPEQAFTTLAFNAFNYQECGADAYDAAVQLSTGVAALTLRYHSLDELMPALDQVWRTHVPAQGPGGLNP